MVYTDSSSAKSVSTRNGLDKSTKHVELRYLYVQQLSTSGIIQIRKINTLHNISDILTKYVNNETLQRHLPTIGLHPGPQQVYSIAAFTISYPATTYAHVPTARESGTSCLLHEAACQLYAVHGLADSSTCSSEVYLLRG